MLKKHAIVKDDVKTEEEEIRELVEESIEVGQNSSDIVLSEKEYEVFLKKYPTIEDVISAVEADTIPYDEYMKASHAHTLYDERNGILR